MQKFSFVFYVYMRLHIFKLTFEKLLTKNDGNGLFLFFVYLHILRMRNYLQKKGVNFCIQIKFKKRHVGNLEINKTMIDFF
jgi:hypothetical protein